MRRTPRFLPSEMIVSLLDLTPEYNLGESTAPDLLLGDLMDLLGEEVLQATTLGYGSSAGSGELREEVAKITGVAPDQLLILPGAVFGLHLVALETCGPGQNAVLGVPGFPPARDTLLAQDIEVRPVELEFERGFEVDVKRIAGAVDADTGLVSLASPQNPTGVSTSPDVLAEIVLALRRKAPEAYLLVDETYREAVYGSDQPLPSAASTGSRVLTVSSLSKAHGAPGLRTGWLTVPDEALRARLSAAKVSTLLSGSPLTELLALAVLRNRERILAPRRALLARGLDEVHAWRRREAERLEWVRPDAGALCCLRLRPSVFSDEAVGRFWEALPVHGVQLARGPWFGAPDRVFRLGFGFLPLDRLPDALSAVSEALDAVLAGKDAHHPSILDDPC